MPLQEQAKSIAAPPYDVVNRNEAERLTQNNPLSFLHVSRSEVDLPKDVDPYSDQVYEKAVENFNNLRQNAPLVSDKDDSFYIYSLTMNGRTQSGLVAAASVDDYDNDRIKKHELTRQDKEDDRTRHIMELKSHTGPVFLTCKSKKEITEKIDEVMLESVLLDIDADDGVNHKIWRVPANVTQKIISIFQDIPSLYVADGHHRAKSASRTRETLRETNTSHTGNEAYNRFLSVIFPADQLNILSYNRIVNDLNGANPEEFLKNVEAAFNVTKIAGNFDVKKGSFHMYLTGEWYCLTPKSVPESDSVINSLDISILQNQLLKPLLGVDDPRTDNRIGFIGGIHGIERLEEHVDSGNASAAFALHPVTIDELMEISDNGMIMPPKSTWFEPKLRDGLICHCF